MGAEVFEVYARGANAAEAFQQAVEEACHAYGHAGYTGTIAEKDSYVLIDLPEGMNPREFASQLIEEEDDRIDNKWGPAGCITIAPGQYYFFGWASS